MSYWESKGKSDEWYTPKYIFDDLDCSFDLDVASPESKTNVPCERSISNDSLSKVWQGFVWMNPPFEGRNGLVPWLDKFFEHGNGICLTPDRSSTPWYHTCLEKANCMIIVKGKIKFQRPDGTFGKSPSNGTSLFGIGDKAISVMEKTKLGKYIQL